MTGILVRLVISNLFGQPGWDN